MKLGKLDVFDVWWLYAMAALVYGTAARDVVWINIGFVVVLVWSGSLRGVKRR